MSVWGFSSCGGAPLALLVSKPVYSAGQKVERGVRLMVDGYVLVLDACGRPYVDKQLLLRVIMWK